MNARSSFFLLICAILTIITVIYLLVVVNRGAYQNNIEPFDASNSAARDAVIASHNGEAVMNTSSSDSSAKLVLTDPGSLRACIAAAEVCGTRDGYFKNSLSVGEDMSVTGQFGVGGSTYLSSDLDVLGALTVNGLSTIKGAAAIHGRLNVGQGVNTSKNAVVAGNLNANQRANMRKNLDVSGSGTVRGTTHIRGSATINGPASIAKSANVTNTLYVKGGTNIHGTFATNSYMNVGGRMDVGGTSTVRGAAITGGDAQVNGKLTVDGPLKVENGGLRVDGKSFVYGDTTIAEKLNVTGLTKMYGGVNIPSRKGDNMISIGEHKDGENIIYGTTVVKGNKFCLNEDCLTSGELKVVKNNETVLSAKMDEWDKEIKNDMEVVRTNLDSFMKNKTVHNTKEKATYDSLMDAYNRRDESIQKLSVSVPDLKSALYENWLYEVKQDDRIRMIGKRMSTIAGPYYKSVEASMQPDGCPPPAAAVNEKKWTAVFYQNNDYSGNQVHMNESSGNMTKDGENAWIFPTPFGISAWQVSDNVKLFYTDEVNMTGWRELPNNQKEANDFDLRFLRIEMRA